MQMWSALIQRPSYVNKSGSQGSGMISVRMKTCSFKIKTSGSISVILHFSHVYLYSFYLRIADVHIYVLIACHLLFVEESVTKY